MSGAAAPRVSVVTPFYNTKKYLAECIESVLRQSYDDFEYILVDNQSTDGSGAIAADAAARDARVRVVRTPTFFGQVQNYNFALQQISPQSAYCKVVQADDWIFPNCVGEMVTLAEAHPRVAIVSAYALLDKRVICTGLPPDRRVLSGREACRLFLLGGVHMFGSPTTVLYRSDVVRARKPFYGEGRLHEDTEAVFELLVDHDFGMVHQVLTFTREHEDSITGAAQRYAPDALDYLILVKRFGPLYLSPEEQEACLRGAQRSYYGALARASLAGPSRGLWKYHVDGLATADETLNAARLLRHVGAAVVEHVLPPVVLHAWRRARASGRSTASLPRDGGGET